MAFHPQGRVVGALAVKTPHHWQMVGIRLRLGGSNVLPRRIKGRHSRMSGGCDTRRTCTRYHVAAATTVEPDVANPAAIEPC